MEIVGFMLLAIAGLSILRLYDTTHELKERIDALEHLVDKDRKSTRLNSSHVSESRMPSSA